MKTRVTWFRHNHENRNDLLRFGLMKMHNNGEIEYQERPIGDLEQFGFGTNVIRYPDKRHLSFMAIGERRSAIKCIVDNEDSFALVSPLLKDVDIYFSAGYNADFFEKKRFVNAYQWQDDVDLRWYRAQIEEKVNALGAHFHKIKKFIPIAPNLAYPARISKLERKYRNLLHKFNRATGRGNDFSTDYKGFETRYRRLLDMRKAELCHDVVLNDSLWGWPIHRINLHQELQAIHHKGFKVHSILKWTDPVEHDGSACRNLNPEDFPLVTRPIEENYEEMLAQSRLAIFACGFHWGWRNIMTFALMMGIPVLTDRLLTEPYFDMNEFKFYQLEDHSWKSIESYLGPITVADWWRIKEHNQSVYDKYMSPESVGRYFVNACD